MTLTDKAKAQVAWRLGVPVGVCRQWLCLWAGLHDIGKISPPFQAMVPEAYKVVADNPAYVRRPGAERERLRHDVAGHWALTQILADWNYPQASPPPDLRIVRSLSCWGAITAASTARWRPST